MKRWQLCYEIDNIFAAYSYQPVLFSCLWSFEVFRESGDIYESALESLRVVNIYNVSCVSFQAAIVWGVVTSCENQIRWKYWSM